MTPRPSPFRFRELLAAAVLLAPAAALAQACCTGASALAPARLTLHEDALVGVQLSPAALVGSWDGARAFVPSPAGATELRLQEVLVGSIRFLSRGQATAAVPFLETYRRLGGLGEFGGGFGDVVLSGRWDFVQAGESARIPGLAAVLGVQFPTGRPPESAHLPLGTDTTGAGSFQFSAGFAVEQSWAHWFATGTALLTQATPRKVGSITELLGLQVTVIGAAGYAFDTEAALAVTVAYTDSGDAWLNGAVAKGSGRARTTLGVSGALPLSEDWRLQGSLTTDVPAPFLGRNEPTNVGLTLMIVRSWT